MPKAIVLPINILVIVAIATVAMLGLVGVYGVGYNPFSSAMGLESVKNLACRQLVMGGCKVNTSEITVNYDANKDGNISSADTLSELCKNFFGRRDEKSCKQLCGCVGGAVTGPSGPSGGGISLNPSSGTTSPGGTLTSTVTVTRFNSTVSEDVLLSITSCSGATCSLSVVSCFANPSCTSTLTINAGAATGSFSITIRGTGSITGIIKSATYALTISSGASCTSCTSWANGACGAGGCNANERQQTRTGNPVGCTICPDGQGFSRCVADATCCSCTPWINGACGGVCAANQRQQTRTCNPPACLPESQCVADLSCGGVCTCNWNNTYQCGNGCTVFVFWDAWWRRCVCNPSGCGPLTGTTCGGSPEGFMICTANIC